jgi:subtilisin family serine protease
MHRSITVRRRALALTSSLALLAASLLASGSAMANSPLNPKLSALSPSSSYTAPKSVSGRLAKTDPSLLKATSGKTISVMVKLDYDALASYQGDIPGYAATSPQVTGKTLTKNSAAAKKYLGYVQGIQAKFTGALKSAVTAAATGYSYQSVYGGLSVRLPANQAAKLLALPGVAAIQADTLHQPDAVPVNDDDASFIGGNTAYDALGSSSTAGQGVIIADVDTGVWPEHPSFADRTDLSNPPASVNGPRACNFGDNPLTPETDPFTCNDKLIEGQVFLDTYNTFNHDELYPNSARDSNGHGTHTTSTAGGNPIADPVLFGVDRGPIQGIAPGAYLMSYKALGPLGGYTSDLVAAIDQAVADGADVINYSIGPTNPTPAYTSGDDLAFLDAFDAGVVASTSAGNSGAHTAAHQGPWEITVGATTLQRAFTSTATLTASNSDTLSITGASIMNGISSATPVVEASDAPYSDGNCGTAAPAGTFTGKIVICVRGGTHNGVAIGRAEKGANVLHGGAVGMLLINPIVEDTETDNHWLPAVHFDAPAGGQLQAFMSGHTGVTATFTTGEKSVGQGDVMAAFSSTGPGGDWLKPDIAAPGVQILAGNTPTPTDVASGPPGQYYQAIAGTSMSAPHITGSAALVLALHPGWSPAQVKSALMLTANRNVVESDGSTPANPFDDGAGRVDLAGVVSPGLVMDVSRSQMDAVLTDAIHRIDLNEPSVYDASLPGIVTTTRTVTNSESKSETFSVSVASDLAGAISVSPSSFSVKPGKSATLSITLNGTSGTVGQWYFGQIDLAQSNGAHHVHLPVAFKPTDASSTPSVTLSSSCTPSSIAIGASTSCTAHVVNNAFDDAIVSATMSSSSNLKIQSSNGRIHGTTGTFGPTTLAAAIPPKPSVAAGDSPFGYNNLDDFGIPQTATGDDTIANYNVRPFVYDGVTYSQIGVGSNGYVVVGGGSAGDISSTPPAIPNTARPNNVLAPFWTDLDGGGGAYAGQGTRVATLCLSSTGPCWTVVQWDEHPFGQSPSILETFQLWIGSNGPQDISFVYDVTRPLTATGLVTQVGAEDVTGQFGNSVAGTPSTDLVVTSSAAVPGGSADFTSVFRGTATGAGWVETDLDSSLSRDTSVSRAPVTVTP